MVPIKGPVITKAAFEACYGHAGSTLKQVAHELGCSYNRLIFLMREWGCIAKPKTRNWHRKARIPQLTDATWLHDQLVVQDKSFQQVATELGTSRGNVADHAYRLGVSCKAATQGEAIRKAIRRQHPNGRFGSDTANWRGGRFTTVRGYVYVYRPEHPHATKAGYVFEHRLVMEEMLGRLLEAGEVVHHRNGKKGDNRPENLELEASKAAHAQKHFDAVKVVHELQAEIERLRSENADLRIQAKHASHPDEAQAPEDSRQNS